MIQVNEHFDGQVKSLATHNSQGQATVGVIDAGQYEFGTGSIEIMTVVWGALKAEIPGQETRTYQKGEFFRVEKGVSFKVEATEPTAYLCQYL